MKTIMMFKKVLVASIVLCMLSIQNVQAEQKTKVIKVKKVIEVEEVVPVDSQEEKSVDPASSRVIYGPTALPNYQVHKTKLTVFDLGLWELDYAATEHLNIGFQAAPPFGIFMLGGMARYTHSFSPNVHVGVFANAGVLGTLVGDGNAVTYYGGGPMLTIGDHRKALNISVLNYGAMHDSKNGFAMLPGLGGSIQLSDRVKFNIEGYYITTPTGRKFIRNAGAVLYGIRVFSETGSVYGDISFLAPIYSGGGDLYRFIPLGIPVLAFGFSF